MATNPVSFIQQPPVIEIVGGVVLVRDECIERAMSLSTLARVVDRGQRALKRHAAGETSVIVDD